MASVHRHGNASHPAFPDSAYCPAFQATLELLGKRWTAAIMRALFAGPLRFNEAGRLIPGLSHRLLIERLSELQTVNLVERHDDGSVQVYRLTDQGLDLRHIFEAVEAWNRRWLTEDVHPDSGHHPRAASTEESAPALGAIG